VLDILSGQCETKNECVYPQKYQPLDNTCYPNPHLCAQGAFWDIINQRCISYHDESTCPDGWAITINLTCVEDGGSDLPSSSGSTNSASHASANNASSGQQASSRATGGSGPQDPKPPVSPSDNTSPSQPTTSSQPIPAGISNADCLSKFSAQACNAIQNCQLTFGSSSCFGVTSSQPCPNRYTINGQIICVNQAPVGSGSGTSSGTQSSQAGQCDPTAKSYDECMGRNRTPSVSDTQSVIDALNNKNQKSLDDYQKSRTDDIKQQTESGISFANAPNQFKTFLSSYVPSAATCVPLSIDIKNIHAKIDCSIFALIKTGFAWFFSLMAAFYIWSIAMRPVPEQSS
jgi:hypothetical protein